MRYELTDHEWAFIKPMLPNKPRGVARANDRRVLNGIFGCCDPGVLAGPAGRFWSLHHLLQSLRSLAACGRREQDHECASWRP